MTPIDHFIIAVYEMLLLEEHYTETQALCITSKVRVLHARFFPPGADQNPGTVSA